MMVGRRVQLTVDRTVAKPKEPVLEVADLVVHDDRGQVAVNGVSLDVRSGEIVCVAGVQGNGQTELVEALTGLRQVAAGSVRVERADVTRASPRHVLHAGV